MKESETPFRETHTPRKGILGKIILGEKAENTQGL